MRFSQNYIFQIFCSCNSITNHSIGLRLFLAYCVFVFPYNDPPVLWLDKKYNFATPKTIRFLSKIIIFFQNSTILLHFNFYYNRGSLYRKYIPVWLNFWFFLFQALWRRQSLQQWRNFFFLRLWRWWITCWKSNIFIWKHYFVLIINAQIYLQNFRTFDAILS